MDYGIVPPMNAMCVNLLRHLMVCTFFVVGLGVMGCMGKRVAISPVAGIERLEPELEAIYAPMLPEEETLNTAFTGHLLGPGDEIDIQVFREPEFSGKFVLDENGRFRHPLMGLISIADMSVADAEQMIADLLEAEFLVNPRVMVTLTMTLKSQIVILGEVKNPGVYPVPVNEITTLLQVIALAGGFTALASPDRVTIVRRQEDGTITIPARVSDMLRGRGKHRDIELEPDDVIMVPKIIF